MRGHNVMLETVCATYASIVAPCEAWRDFRVACAWRQFDARMMVAARHANEIGDWREHEHEWTRAQADRAAITNEAWLEYREATASTNDWFVARIRRALSTGE